VACVIPTVSSLAQNYPSRPVRIIVGFPPGATADIIARLIGRWLSARLGQSIIVDNRPGASGNIGTAAVVRAPADGYTLLLVTAANAINASLYDNLGFNFTRDVTPVASISRNPFVMEVHHRFRPTRFSSSLPTPKPIRARSRWRRPGMARRTIFAVSCLAR
jgi:tripartite-type tricarboxylate transporter receptor subunit TctC